MIIGIDGNEANVRNRVGVGRYAFELLKQFNELRINNYEFSIYLKNKPLDDLPKETSWWKYKVISPRKFWTQMGLPFNLFFDKPRPDIFFTPTHYAPRFCPCPGVISIMDLSFLYFPAMFKKSDLWQLTNWTAYSVKKATMILAISQASKDDIIKYYGVDEKKVMVTYPGYNPQNMKHGTLNINEKYGIEGDYILSVGTLQPRKNYIKLIEAFSTLNPNPYTLVIVGKKGWMFADILAAPKKFKVENKVKFLDYVPDEDMPALYQNAKCFILISLYEGFGLPVLEAMNYGCPVIVSNASSLPEVVGDAGILVDPNKTDEIKNKLITIFNLSAEERENIIQKGKIQASKFSWEKCAIETLNVLKELGAKNV
ncbi:MAG: glycosyltransferase family 1 protein [Candidatus Gottesmanbacteria bacterium]